MYLLCECKELLLLLTAKTLTEESSDGVHYGVVYRSACEKLVIGASLSEPHTSVTALAEIVCMYVCLRPYTVNFK